MGWNSSWLNRQDLARPSVFGCFLSEFFRHRLPCRANLYRAAVLICLFGFGFTQPASALAAEPAAEFLAKLKERGYFDMVQAYTKQIEAEGIQVEGIGSLEAQQALTAAALANQERDPKKRESMITRAKSQLQEFVKKNPKDPAIGDAKEWIRTFTFEQAQKNVALAGATIDESKKADMLKKAASLFDEAQQAADDHVDNLKKEITAFRSLPSEERDSDKQAELKGTYLVAKLTAARVKFLSATALTGNAKAKRLQAAVKAGGELIDKYSGTVVGYHGELIQGQCYRDLGEYEDSIKVLKSLAESEEPALRALTTQAIGATVASHVGAGSLDDGIQIGEKWLKAAGDSNDPNQTEVELAMAKAYGAKAQSAAGNEQNALSAKARKLIDKLARTPGPKQQEARSILAALPGNAAASVATASAPDEEFKSYAEAKTAGDTATQEVQTSQQMIGVMRGKLTKASAAERTKIEQEIATLESTIKSEGAKIISFYRQAIRLAPADTEPAEINGMRLVSCYSYYGDEDYFSAAVIGEFLARRFSEGPNARRGASIAMASYYKMFEESQAAGNSGESQSSMTKLVDIANYLSKKWPEQPEAQQALITLVQFMIKQGQLGKAQEYLARIPEDSPKRGEADLATGQAYWSQYTEGMKAAGGVATQELNALKSQAQSVLQGGVNRLKKAGPSARLATAMLTLARIYNDSGQPDKSLALLLDKSVGPKTLLDKKHPSTSAKNFDSICYKTLLQAQLGAIAASRDKAGTMKKAQATMDEMAKLYGNDENGKKRLVSIFRSMANDLGEQLEIAPPNQKAALAQGLEAFLNQVQQVSTEFNVLYWASETLYGLGEGFLGPNGEDTPAATRYFASAAKAYGGIMTRVEKGSLKIEPKYATQVRMKAASTQARLGEYDAAVGEFTKILKQNNKLLSLQIEAANVLKAGGAAKQDSDLLSKAIKGTEMNPNTRKNTIWGWERIGLLTRNQITRSDKMRSTFFESQYQVAHCRYLQSKYHPDAARQQKYLASSRSILARTKASYPDLGGPDWKPKFEKLLSIVNDGKPPAQ